MSGYSEHIRGGVRAYGVVLVIALGLWVARSWLPTEGSAYVLPVGAGVVRSVLGVVLCMTIAVLASLAPDIDIKSRGQVLFYRGFLVADLLLVVLYYFRHDLRFLEGAAFLGLLVIFPLVGRHRGWTHSWAALLLLPSPLLLVPMAVYGERVWVGVPYYVAAVVGYGSHLAMDGKLFGRHRSAPRGGAADTVGRREPTCGTLDSKQKRAESERLVETVRENRTRSDRSRKRA